MGLKDALNKGKHFGARERARQRQERIDQQRREQQFAEYRRRQEAQERELLIPEGDIPTIAEQSFAQLAVEAFMKNVDQDVYLECHEGPSHKYYRLIRVGSVVYKQYGRLPGFGIKWGMNQQMQEYDTDAAARHALDRQNGAKVSKGYSLRHAIPQLIQERTAKMLASAGVTVRQERVNVRTSRSASTGEVETVETSTIRRIRVRED
jgi:predicted DNA-binding WGR domain protein